MGNRELACTERYEEKLKNSHMKGEIAKSLHAVMIPFPAQGHVTPCLQLARKLVEHGFRITFVNTDHNHERMMKSRLNPVESEKDITFVAVSDGLPVDHPRLSDLKGFCKATLEMGPTFEELLLSLLLQSPITCVIQDDLFSCVYEKARKLGIPVVGLATASAISVQCIYHLQTYIAAGILPLPPPPALAYDESPNPIYGLPQSDEEAAAQAAQLTPIPGASPTMRVEDLPTLLLTYDLDSFWIHFYQLKNSCLPKYECILFNTFYDLEGDILDAMGTLNSRIYPIGPLVLESTNVEGSDEVSLIRAGSALWEEDPNILSWLDDQKSNTVLFVCFGSIATMSIEQMLELACGLEMSQHAFLWVIRSDLINNKCDNRDGFQTMFLEFVQRTKDRALLVPWVSQTTALSHPAVGAFFTHCGWNSIMEGISCGLPMLGWPHFADQNTNCHYIVEVWKIGLHFERNVKDGQPIVSKEEVARKVRRIMAREETDLAVDQIRTNIGNFRMAARKAVERRGASQIALSDFVKFIENLTQEQIQST